MIFQLIVIKLLELPAVSEAACRGHLDSSGVCIANVEGSGLLQVKMLKGNNEAVSEDGSNIVESTTTTTPRMFVNRQYLPVKNYGIWDRSNKFTKAQRPFLRGWASNMQWSEFEPQEGRFNFSYLDSALQNAYKNNGSFYSMVTVGPDSPPWIYNYTVRVEVEPDPLHIKFNDTYPYYMCPIYNQLRNKMFVAFGNYIRNHVHNGSIGFVQATFGCTGDAVLYKRLPLNESYRINTTQARDHMFETWNVYKMAFQDGPGRIIPILINPIDDEDQEQQDFAIATFSAMGFKGSAYVRGHHLNGEHSFVTLHQAKLLNATTYSPNPFQFARAEHDQSWKKPVFQINVQLGFHWAIITGLNQGLSVHDVAREALDECYNQGFADSFEFFSLYAPQIWPHNATNAFIALHEGLDAADLDKFPEGDQFGPMGLGIDRIMNICQKYAAFGCSNDDPPAALFDQIYQRSYQTGYNDVGYDIWRTNYGRWIEQIEADVTSQGLFRIGGNITSSTPKYARFARGLVHSSGKTGMYFKLSDGFFATSPPDLLRVHLIWFDNAPGSFQVKFTADAPRREVVGLDQPCTGDKQWKHAYFSMSQLGPRLNAKGSDFSIVSKDSTDVIVHMIEISRELK